MRTLIFILKTLIVLICFVSYFSMMKVLYCGCWACNTAIVIGILALAIILYDRYRDFRSR